MTPIDYLNTFLLATVLAMYVMLYRQRRAHAKALQDLAEARDAHHARVLAWLDDFRKDLDQ